MNRSSKNWRSNLRSDIVVLEQICDRASCYAQERASRKSRDKSEDKMGV